MKFKSIKTATEAGVPGIEFVYTDKVITEVVFGKLRIRKGESYSAALQVLIERPYDEVERYRLTGKIDGFPDAISYHESRSDADCVGVKLECSGAKIEIEKLNVLIDEAGNFVGPSNTDVTSDNSDDLPF